MTEPHRVLIDSGLQVYATQYLIKVPNLRALSIVHGSTESVLIGDVEIEPHFYSRGKIIDAYGRAEAVAVAMPKHRVQEIEPVSDVLDLAPQIWRLLRYGYRV